jgi:hypothetical protein
MIKPTRLELFAAFTSLFPLLTRDDLEATVEAMRGTPGFTRMLANARAQAEEIGFTDEELGEAHLELAVSGAGPARVGSSPRLVTRVAS